MNIPPETNWRDYVDACPVCDGPAPECGGLDDECDGEEYAEDRIVAATTALDRLNARFA